MSGRLRGKVAIVTGGGSGFGAGIAKKFLAEGAKVVIADMSQEMGTKVAGELGCQFQKGNVTKLDDWKAIVKATLDAYEQIDIVVNNAGTTYQNKPTHTVTQQEFDLVMDVNVKSIYLSSVVLLPYFLDSNRKGVFLNIASTAGIRPRPGLAWYNASKAAVSNATKGMAVEYAPKGIRFNAICPVIAAGTGLYVISSPIWPLLRPSTDQFILGLPSSLARTTLRTT